MPSHRMLAAWTMLLFIAAAWEGLCAHSIYDLRLSTDDCVRLKSRDVADDCSDPEASCASPTTVQQSSPRWLSDLAGMGGPLMTWLPMLLGNKEAVPVRHVLLTALPWCGPLSRSDLLRTAPGPARRTPPPPQVPRFHRASPTHSPLAGFTVGSVGARFCVRRPTRPSRPSPVADAASGHAGLASCVGALRRASALRVPI